MNIGKNAHLAIEAKINGKVVWKCFPKEAAIKLGISVHYLYYLNNIGGYLPNKAKCDEIIIKGKVFGKKPNDMLEKGIKIKREYGIKDYAVGDKIKISGKVYEITDIKDNVYTFNNDFKLTARNKYTNYATIYKAIRRYLVKEDV